MLLVASERYCHAMTPEKLETSDLTATIICKGQPPLWHLLAILKAIEADDRHGQDIAINVVTLTPESPAYIPTGNGGVISGPAGTLIVPPDEAALTWENCPPGGLVHLPEFD